ncbi:MAG: endolytic transglycosylase MltG [Gemmatimonadetes bacterium]|nr:endolytic transglycosylase MltG [Gemmatimonadota bacterium]
MKHFQMEYLRASGRDWVEWVVGGGFVVAAIALIAVATWRPGPPVELTVPEGATLEEVADTLSARGVIRARPLFVLVARILRTDREIKAGPYLLRERSSWTAALGALTRGEVLTERLTIPEGFTLAQIKPRVAEMSNAPIEWVDALVATPGLDAELGVPGPGLEGYLFPDTYYFAYGVGPRTQFEAMVARYKNVWTPARRARLDSIGMTEAEIVTLASIVQAEARRTEEMPRIAGVYQNRLRIGMLLQADPTVLYALGGYRERLLFAAIDSVADNPYNTYTQPGLPPGPIGSPGEAAIDAALHPTGDDLYFVAWPDGTHVFTQSLADHNQAVGRARAAAGRGS